MSMLTTPLTATILKKNMWNNTHHVDIEMWECFRASQTHGLGTSPCWCVGVASAWLFLKAAISICNKKHGAGNICGWNYLKVCCKMWGWSRVKCQSEVMWGWKYLRTWSFFVCCSLFDVSYWWMIWTTFVMVFHRTKLWIARISRVSSPRKLVKTGGTLFASVFTGRAPQGNFIRTNH